jgi:hypothetical protein
MIIDNYIDMLDFGRMRQKEQNFFTRREYANAMVEKALTLFTYEGLPDSIPAWFIELTLLRFGIVGFGRLNGAEGVNLSELTEDVQMLIKDFGNYQKAPMLVHDDNIYAFVGGYTGAVTAYPGICKDFVGACPIGSFSGEVNKDIVVGWNNSTRTPDAIAISRYAELLTQTDISIMSNIFFSRNIPLPIATTDTEKKAYQDAIDKLKTGEPSIPLSSTLKDLFGESGQLQTLDITRPDTVKNLQDLSLFHDEVVKRIAIEANIDIASRDKKAQITTKELDAFSQYGLITFVDKLECRRKMCEDLNTVFGLNVTVEPNKDIYELDGVVNELLEREEQTNEEGQPEETVEQPEESTEGSDKENGDPAAE